MASKSSSPGPNAPAAPAAKQARSRKATTQKQDIETTTAGRAGSAGGIVLEREKGSKLKNAPTTPKTPAKPVSLDTPTEAASNTTNKARRKPRKLNKDPTSATTNPATATPPSDGVVTDATSATELEALKSRVRGLEAKVEELYKNGSSERSNRSPRRRGKGRKNSSAQQVPILSTPSTTKPTATKAEDTQDVVDGEEEADEELVRLEDELEVARQDLARYRPRNRRSRSGQTNVDDDVEEIPRDAPGVENSGTTRQVTLSGSYRIPLPASVNTEDLKTIQSGVSAAQNVARSFLEQRRAAAALREQQSAGTRTTSSSSAAQKRPKPAKSVSSSMSVVEGEKQSWSEWFGGYSVAISRAVKSIEHEAAVESQRVATPSSGVGDGGGKKKATGGLKGTGKRPPAKATMSSEQVQGLMS